MTRFQHIIIMSLLLFITVVGIAFCWSPPLVVDVVSIQFNYEVGNVNDALNIRKNASQTVELPEWLPSSGRNNTFAYTKGQTNRKIQVVLHHNQAPGNIYNLHVKTVGGGYYPGLVAETQVDFPPSGSQTTTILTMSGGAVPTYVQLWGFYYYWQITKVNGVVLNPTINFGQTGGHNYYTLLGVPQAPMPTPWTDVLNYACVWAANQTTERNVVKKITQNAYTVFGQNHSYYGENTHAPYPVFNLTSFFSSNWADCRDMSAVVHVFSRAIGCGNIKIIKINNFQPRNFAYDWIYPVGCSNPQQGYWWFHQIGWLSMDPIETRVFDACLKLTKNSTRIPVNENIYEDYQWDLLLYDIRDSDGRDQFRLESETAYTTVN